MPARHPWADQIKMIRKAAIDRVGRDAWALLGETFRDALVAVETLRVIDAQALPEYARAQELIRGVRAMRDVDEGRDVDGGAA